MSKALGYYTFSGEQNVLAGGTLPLTNTIRQYGKNITLNNNGVLIHNACGEMAAGYYSVATNATITASAAGTATVTLYQDDQPVPAATQTVTTTADGITHFSFTAPVRVFCGQTQSTLTLRVSGQNVSVTNTAITVIKE